MKASKLKGKIIKDVQNINGDGDILIVLDDGKKLIFSVSGSQGRGWVKMEVAIPVTEFKTEDVEMD